MRAHNKVEVFNVCMALKFPIIYKELLMITVINEQMIPKYVTSKDPLERMIMDQYIEDNAKVQELASVFDMPSVIMLKKHAKSQ